MTYLTVHVDDRTEHGLKQLTAAHGGDMAALASRLLARAVRAARPRRAFDTAAIAAANAPFQHEDEELAESGAAERADLLAREDLA